MFIPLYPDWRNTRKQFSKTEERGTKGFVAFSSQASSFYVRTACWEIPNPFDLPERSRNGGEKIQADSDSEREGLCPAEQTEKENRADHTGIFSEAVS